MSAAHLKLSTVHNGGIVTITATVDRSADLANEKPKYRVKIRVIVRGGPCSVESFRYIEHEGSEPPSAADLQSGMYGDPHARKSVEQQVLVEGESTWLPINHPAAVATRNG